MKASSLLVAVLASVFIAAQAEAQLAAPIVSTAALGVSSITWTWTSSPGATGYRVLSSTGGGNISGNLSASASFFSLISLQTNTSWQIQIEAFNGGATADSLASAAYTLAAAPTGTTLLGPTSGAVYLSWNGNGNTSTTTYHIQWWSAGSSSFTVSTQSVNATITNLYSNTTIFFAVQALNGDGLATSFDVTLSTFFPVAPSFPSFVSTSCFALGTTSLTWTWSAPDASAVGYQLFDATGNAVSPVLPPNKFTFTETGLSSNTAYTRLIVAENKTSSNYSGTLTRFTLAAPTTGLTLLGLSGAVESLAWGPNGNPASTTTYNILWWTNATATVTISTTGPTALVPIYAGNTVYFTIQAQNGDGINANFDSTFFLATFASKQSTYTSTALQALTPGMSGIIPFALPTGLVTLNIASNTFLSGVNVSVIVPPPALVPAPTGNFGALTTPVNLQITATDAFGNTQQPARPVLVTVTYGSAGLGQFDPGALVLARYDTARGVWVPLVTSRDPLNKLLTGVTDHFTLFAVLGLAPPADFSTITIGPNPLRPISNPGQAMTFRNVPAGARVRIYGYLGELLNDFIADAAGMAFWDGRNKSGQLVASGVYLALIEHGGSKTIRHLAIER